MSNKSVRLGVWSILTIFPCFLLTLLWNALLLAFCPSIPVAEGLPLWMGALLLLPVLVSPGIGAAGLVRGIRNRKECRSRLGMVLSALGIAGNALFWYGFYLLASTH